MEVKLDKTSAKRNGTFKLLLPDIRLHNKKYSRFYSITDTRKRKVMNVKKHKKYNGIQLRYKGYMASR